MNKNYLKFTKLLTLVAMFGLTLNYFAVKSGAFEANASQQTCPEGNGWTKIDSDDMSTYPVAGATDYCFKAGRGLFSSWPLPDGACGLSHWSYATIEVSPTPSPSDDPSPTPSATPEVSPTPSPSATPEVSPTPSPTPNCEELENCEDPSPTPSATPEVTPTPTPNSCDPEQFCSTSCGRVAEDLPNGSCGIKHCDPTASCVDPNPTPTPEDRPIGGTSGQVLGATTDSYAATGVAEDVAFSLLGLTGTGLSSLGILIRRNEKKKK